MIKGLLFAILCLSLCACTDRSVSFVNAKVFALNPEEYVGVRMGFQGRVVSQGPGSAWFELEDDTGRLLVGTERLGIRIECSKDSQIKLVGTLTKLKQGNMLYLSVDDLLSCKG